MTESTNQFIADVRRRFLAGESVITLAEMHSVTAEHIESALRFAWVSNCRECAVLLQKAVDLMLIPMLPAATALPDDSGAPDVTGRIQ